METVVSKRTEERSEVKFIRTGMNSLDSIPESNEGSDLSVLDLDMVFKTEIERFEPLKKLLRQLISNALANQKKLEGLEGIVVQQTTKDEYIQEKETFRKKIDEMNEQYGFIKRQTMMIKSTKEDFDRKLKAIRTDVANLSSRMQDHGEKDEGQFEIDRLNKLSQNFGLFKNLNNRLTQMEAATQNIDKNLKQIQKMERQVEEQDNALEQVEQYHAGLKQAVAEVQKSHSNEIMPRIEKLESDIDLHQKMFAQLKEQDLQQLH